MSNLKKIAQAVGGVVVEAAMIPNTITKLVKRATEFAKLEKKSANKIILNDLDWVIRDVDLSNCVGGVEKTLLKTNGNELKYIIEVWLDDATLDKSPYAVIEIGLESETSFRGKDIKKKYVVFRGSIKTTKKLTEIINKTFKMIDKKAVIEEL